MSNKISVQTHRPLLRFGTLRSGIAYTLVVAWLAFSIAGSLQHCCRALAASPANVTQLAGVVPGMAGEPVNSNASQDDDDDHCPQLTSIDAVVPVALLLPDAPSVYAIVASYINTELATPGYFPSTYPYPPLPPWRLYLSTQRLRI